MLSLSGCFGTKKTVSTDSETGIQFIDPVKTSGEMYFEAYHAEVIDQNIEKALKLYRECLKNDPQNTAAMFRMGSIQLNARNFEETIDLMNKATQLAPDNRWYWELLVEAYGAAGDYLSAIKVVESMLKIFPEHKEYYLDLANLYIMNKDRLNAIEAFNRFEERFGLNPEIIERKKDLYLKMGKPDKAVDEVMKLVIEYPANTLYLKALVPIYMISNNELKVMEIYRKVLRIDPNDGQAILIIADYKWRHGEFDSAVIMAKKAFMINSVDIQSKIQFAVYNVLKQGVTDSNKTLVMELGNLLLKTHPTEAAGHVFMADVYSEAKQPDSAFAEYNRALFLDPQKLQLWKKAIYLNMDNKKYKSADSLCEKAMEYFPNNPELYLLDAQSLIQLQEYQKAVSLLEEGKGYIYNNKSLKIDFLTLLGETCNTLKDYPKSDKYFEEALALDENDALVLNNYAYYLSLRKENLGKAESMSKQAITLEPKNSSYLDTYGWIQYLKGNYQEAATYIGIALKARPWDADLLEHYGDALYKNGDVNSAVEYWKMAKLKGSQTPFIDRKIADKKLYE